MPDANTLWDFREALIAAKALDGLFIRLDQAISAAGYLPMSGEISGIHVEKELEFTLSL